MSIHDQYQLDSYDNDIIALSNESNVSDISENPNDSDIESNSSSPEQFTLQNNGITVITNSLSKRIQKKKLLRITKNRDLVKVDNKDTCDQEYKLLTGTGNLKSHLCQVYRILPFEPNNKNNQLVNIASNQSSLHDFLNKKTLLLSSKLTIHWISPEFTLYQAFLTIQKFDYPHIASTDNAFSMTKAMKQLDIKHIGDGFNIKEVDDLINKAKLLNNFVNQDKYYKKLCRLQAELNPQHPINSLSSDTRTYWSSIYNLLKNLLLFRNAIIQLADDLRQNELAKLLYPFAQATKYIRGNQYPTLGMIIPILIKLLCHLRDFYPTIILITVKACCRKINESMLSRWFELSLNIENEVAFYDNLSQIPKYHIKDEEYSK
ncbi:15235_t:CDS:2, partial [Cetraspora pellucida]